MESEEHNMHYDVLIIGSGITGCSIAMELSKYQLNVLVIEKENDVSMKTTKANSGIVHAGYDPKPGTMMARLNVLGCKMIHDLAPIMNFHYQNRGSLVIGSTEEDHKIINELYDRGVKNGVPGLMILKTQKEVHDLEPNLASDIDYALYAQSAGIVSPWEMALAFSYTAKENGVDFVFDAEVERIEKKGEDFTVHTKAGEYSGSYIINCAGTHADEIYALALGHKAPFEITPVKGEYYLLDKNQGPLVDRVIFQTPSALGKGVLVSRTVHGNLIVGPNASEDTLSKDDTSTTSAALDYVRDASKRSCDKIDFRNNIRNFSGERATIKGYDDFYIKESDEVKHFINFAGIKSPGLTSGPAFGLEAKEILSSLGLEMKEKEDFHYYRLPTYFKDMTMEEKEEAIKKDKRFGQVICRCETVTEGEIIQAMEAPLPGMTIDAIKRRTNAGMGRCQGGFCGPKIYMLLKEKFGMDFDIVYQDAKGSSVVVEKTKED